MFKHPILSYDRFKHEDKRGYDIISLDKKNERNLNDIRVKNKETSWEHIVNNVDGKNFINILEEKDPNLSIIKNLKFLFSYLDIILIELFR